VLVHPSTAFYLFSHASSHEHLLLYIVLGLLLSAAMFYYY
jgi:hypothetical protein